MKFLSALQIVAMHDVLLERYGGDEGGGHRGSENEGAEAAAQAVKNSYYETTRELAAAYAVYVVQGHIFLDGNKRTGAAALLTFLRANGSTPSAFAARPETYLKLQKASEAGASTASLIHWLAKKI